MPPGHLYALRGGVGWPPSALLMVMIARCAAAASSSSLSQGEALARLGLQSSQGHVAASPAPSPNKATERPGTAATNKTTSSRSAEKAPAVEPTSATFIRAITFDGPSTTVAGLTKIQLTAKALFNATDEWGYRSVLTDMNGSIGGAADASGRRARTPAGGEEAAATAGA